MTVLLHESRVMNPSKLNFRSCYRGRGRLRGHGCANGAYRGGSRAARMTAMSTRIRPAIWATRLQSVWKHPCSRVYPGKLINLIRGIKKKNTASRCTSLNVIRDPYASAVPSSYQVNARTHTHQHHILHHGFESRSLPTSNRLASRSLSNDSVYIS